VWPPQWFPQWTGPAGAAFAEAVRELFQPAPETRITALEFERRGEASPVLRPLFRMAHGGRGPFSLVQGTVENDLLRLLQTDPAWRGSLQALRAQAEGEEGCLCMAPEEKKLKTEEVGYCGDKPPDTLTCNGIDCHEKLRAKTVSALVAAFRKNNANKFARVTAAIVSALTKLPEDLLGKNGRRFLKKSLSITGLLYGWIQVMRCGTRVDTEHFDGGSSIFAGGLTVFGRRCVNFFIDDAWETDPYEQKPGDFYIGTLASPFHRVEHSASRDTHDDLFWDGPDAEHGLKIVIIFRSDLFAANRGRNKKSKAGPVAVFDIVNHTLAADLAREPWQMPVFAEVVAELDKEEAAAASGAAPNAEGESSEGESESSEDESESSEDDAASTASGEKRKRAAARMKSTKARKTPQKAMKAKMPTKRPQPMKRIQPMQRMKPKKQTKAKSRK